MRAAVFEGPGNVRVEQVPDAEVIFDTDALVRITHAGICGSDLWSYRGYGQRAAGSRIGQEFIGVVEDVGAEVRTVRPGDLVVAPATWSDGTCEFCLRNLQSSCVDGGMWGEPGYDGGQGEAARVPYADGTLMVIPPSLHGAERRVLPLCTVLSAGHHAAKSAGVSFAKTVVIIGDGAVGLCAVLASRRLGAERVVVVGHHLPRLELAERFGASDVISGRGAEVVERVMTLTGGAHAVLECVGAQTALDTAIAVARDGATIGYVGTPHLVEQLDLGLLFARNINVSGGLAPVRAYLPQLIPEVATGGLDASAIFDQAVSLDGVPDGYVAMDTRKTVKVHIEV